jgi:phosphoribosylformylglycinamidine synthase
MGQLAAAIAGLGEACSALSTPVVSGNVSLYTETDGRAINPTPTVGMVGLMRSVRDAVPTGFSDGHLIALVGVNSDEIGGSEYLALLHGCIAGPPPALDLGRERAVGRAAVALARARLVHSAHDCAEGGLAVALAECCLHPTTPVGATVRLTDPFRADLLLFGEAPSRIVLSFAEERRSQVEQICASEGAPFAVIGATGGRALTVDGPAGRLLSVPIEQLKGAYSQGFRRLME